MVYLNIKTKIIAASIISFLIILILLWNPAISNTIESRGKLLSQKSFILRTNTSGSLESFLINNQSGMVENYSIYNFERGDIVDFKLYSNNSDIETGDTLVVFSSGEYERELSALNLSLSDLEGSLAILSSGEKTEILDEMKLRIKHAEEKLATEEKIYERSKLLLDRNIISQQDFDIVEGNLKMAQIELSIAEQTLANVETGSKPEQITAIQKQIKEARHLTFLMEQQSDRLNIISPIEGRIQFYDYNDTLLVVNTSYDNILQFPLPATKLNQVNIGDTISIYRNNEEINVTVTTIDDNVFFVSGKPYFKITSNSFQSVELMPINGLVDCEIVLDEIYLLDYLKEVIN